MIAAMGDSILETAGQVLFPLPTLLGKALSVPGQVSQAVLDASAASASVDAAARSAQDTAEATKTLVTIATVILVAAAAFATYKYVLSPSRSPRRRSRR